MVWQIAKSTKKCAICDRLFQGEEDYFAALFLNPLSADGKTPVEEFGRKDFCLNCWANRPARPDVTSGRSGEDQRAGIFSFWQTRMAAPQKAKTPREVLAEFFDNLFKPGETGETPSQPRPNPDLIGGRAAAITPESRDKIIYLFSLILLRKRIFKIKENVTRDNQVYLVFERVPDAKIYEVKEMTIPDSELVSLRKEFSKLFEFEI